MHTLLRHKGNKPDVTKVKEDILKSLMLKNHMLEKLTLEKLTLENRMLEMFMPLDLLQVLQELIKDYHINLVSMVMEFLFIQVTQEEHTHLVKDLIQDMMYLCVMLYIQIMLIKRFLKIVVVIFRHFHTIYTLIWVKIDKEDLKDCLGYVQVLDIE